MWIALDEGAQCSPPHSTSPGERWESCRNRCGGRRRPLRRRGIQEDLLFTAVNHSFGLWQRYPKPIVDEMGFFPPGSKAPCISPPAGSEHDEALDQGPHGGDTGPRGCVTCFEVREGWGTKWQRRLGSVAAPATPLPGAPSTALLLWLLSQYISSSSCTTWRKINSVVKITLFAHKIPAGSVCFLLVMLYVFTWCPRLWTRVMPCDVGLGSRGGGEGEGTESHWGKGGTRVVLHVR